MINGGVSQFPFIIYDATTQKAYYRHYFQGSSCNYNSSLGGTTYNNTYSVSATKTAPCPGSQSTAAVGPIVISESPEANIVGDDSVCTSTNYLVQDLSGQGKMVVASGSDFTCDPTANGYWEVYDSQWNLLTLPNNKFSLNTGSSLGSGGIFPTVPAYWTSGSNNLNLQFLQFVRPGDDWYRPASQAGCGVGSQKSCFKGEAQLEQKIGLVSTVVYCAEFMPGLFSHVGTS